MYLALFLSTYYVPGLAFSLHPTPMTPASWFNYAQCRGKQQEALACLVCAFSTYQSPAPTPLGRLPLPPLAVFFHVKSIILALLYAKLPGLQSGPSAQWSSHSPRGGP